MDYLTKISQLEEEIRTTPYHKATEHHIGRLRARIAQLRDLSLSKIPGGKDGGSGFAVKKTGDATIVLIGPPSVGKSTLINALTASHSKVASYDFTTLGVVPGLLDYQGAKIQIFDLPGIIKGAVFGKGRGREVLSVCRSADLILIIVDYQTVNLIDNLVKELNLLGVHLNQSPPKIIINKKTKGGLKISNTVPLSLSRETIKQISQQFRINNAEILIKESINLEQLIDAFSQNRRYLPSLIVINKIDLKRPKNLPEEAILISAQRQIGLEALKQAIWDKLNLIRVYLRHDRQTDYQEPLVLKKGDIVLKAAEKVSRQLASNLKSAQIWGPSAKYPGQTVSLNHPLVEGDIIEFNK